MRRNVLIIVVFLIGCFSLLSVSNARDGITCPGAPPTRLTIGLQGRVTPGLPNNVRLEPGTRAPYVGEIPSGGIFNVLGGPVCADGYAWWQVSYEGIVGWTPEGLNRDYWLEPYPPPEAAPLNPSPIPLTLLNAPAVSSIPDGEDAIAFLSAPQVGDAVNLYIMNANGSNVRRLSEFHSSIPLWSPDGGYILVAGGALGSLGTINVRTGEPRIILDNTVSVLNEFSWSADGAYVAFTSLIDGNQDILVVELATGMLTNVTNHPSLDSSPSWSPDGTQIAFSSNRDDGQHIYTVGRGGDNLRQLTSEDYNTSPDWSPDGGTIAWAVNGELWTMNQDGSRKRQITARAPRNVDSVPAWSPDGTWIAFHSRPVMDTRTTDLLIVRPDGSDIRPLSMGGVTNLRPAWSPDSTHLVYQSAADRIIYRINLAGQVRPLIRAFDISALPAWRPSAAFPPPMVISGAAMTATPNPTQQVPQVIGNVSLQNAPPVNTLAQNEDVIAFLSAPQPNAPTNLYVMNPDGSSIRLLQHNSASRPTWSPDGRMMLSWGVGGHIKDTLIGGMREIFPNRFVNPEFVWSPDGAYLCFTIGDGTQHDLFVTDIATSQTYNLTNHPGMDYSPAWSPDGARIAFISDRDGISNLYTIAPDGSNLRHYTREGHSMSPAWSPDGTRIAWVFNSSLAIVEADARNLQPIPSVSVNSDALPVWSPDGEWIAFLSQRGDDPNFNLYITRPDGSELRKLTNDADGLRDAVPSWSPDSRYLVYQSITNLIYRVDINSGVIIPLIQTYGFEAYPSWRPKPLDGG